MSQDDSTVDSHFEMKQKIKLQRHVRNHSMIPTQFNHDKQELFTGFDNDNEDIIPEEKP